MEPERWQRIGEVLHRVLERPAEERTAFLAEACGGDTDLYREVERLVRADENAGAFLGRPLLEDRSGGHGAWAGRRIGPYRLLHKIGEGGMSTVYVALRDDDQYRRRVAVKLLRLGIESEDKLRRFRRERQILASLDHPNIALLFEGGATDEGVPYIVMEYIEGEPIDEYCDRHRLSIRERLELFRKVCSAVRYAHQNLVVHRDLKPGNILVTVEGVPKLLDFGIAKLLHPELAFSGGDPTTTWQRVLTPDYASPEQVQGRSITTASDVYSLGVLLYKLLTGQPFHRFADKSALEIERILTETEPERPSAVFHRQGRSSGRLEPALEKACRARRTRPEQLRRELAGDLDHIVVKALRPEPQRRYSSVGELAEELRRHLDGLPVLARTDTLGYRFSKLIRRHKVGVGMATLVTALVIGSAAMILLQSARVARQRDVARLERDKSRQALAFVEGIFKGADPGEARGEELSARQVVERGTERVLEELREQPEVRASILNSLGNIYRNLGLYERAEELLRKALATRREALDPQHGDIAESLNDLSLLLMDQGQFDEAEPLLHEALAIRSRFFGEEHSETGEALNNIGLIESYEGRFDSAESYLRRGLETNRKVFGNEHGHVALSLSNLALTLAQKGDHEEAESAYLEALSIQRKVFGAAHPEIGATLANLGLLYRTLGKLDAAEDVLREALAMQRELVGDEHLNVAVLLNGLGIVLEDKGAHDEAEQLLTDALAMWTRLFGKDSQRIANIHYNLANVFRGKGDSVRAEELYRESLEIFARTAPEDNPYVAIVLLGLGGLLVDGGRSAEALPMLTRAAEISRGALGASHRQTALCESLLGKCLTQLERYGEAEPLLVESYRKIEAGTRPNDREPFLARQRVVELYEALGKPEKAAEYRQGPPS